MIIVGARGRRADGSSGCWLLGSKMQKSPAELIKAREICSGGAYAPDDCVMSVIPLRRACG